MLRHYDRVGLVQPTGRTSGGYREYADADLRRLLQVESLRTLGLSLADVKRALDESDFSPTDLVADLITHTRARITAEQVLLADLERVNAAGPAAWSDVAHVIATLRALESESAGRRQQAVLGVDDATLGADALVEALLSEDNPNVAGALRWALARAPGHGFNSLATGLDSADVSVRRRAVAAVEVLATLDDTATTAADAARLLRAALLDTDPDVAQRAALALGRGADTDAVPALIAMIVDGTRDVEAAEVLGALHESLAESRIVDDLRAAFTNPSVPVRLRLTQALAEFSGAAATALLDECARGHDPIIAATATGILRGRDR